MIKFWNNRGLNDPLKQKKLSQVLKNYKGIIVCLLEIHVWKEKQPAISQVVLPGWSSLANNEAAPLGRIWLLFDNKITISVYKSSA